MGQNQEKEYQNLEFQNQEYNIIVVGKTGSGKSTLCNKISLGDHKLQQKIFTEGASIQSCTPDCKAHTSHFKGQEDRPTIKVIDTPGFFDTETDDLINIKKICEGLNQVKDGINIVLFVYPATEFRIDQSLQMSLQFLGQIMGEAIYERVFLVITRMDMFVEQEQKNTQKRFVDEVIPYIRDSMELKVAENVIFYKHNKEVDGLDDILLHLHSNQNKYIPEILKDIGQYWVENNKIDSVYELLENSKTVKKIQEQFQKEKEKNEQLEKRQIQIENNLNQIQQDHAKEKEELNKKRLQEHELHKNEMEESQKNYQKQHDQNQQELERVKKRRMQAQTHEEIEECKQIERELNQKKKNWSKEETIYVQEY